MNIYKEKTLNGNWFEERAPALNGVMADYGERCYSTTQKEAFSSTRAEDKALTRAAVLQARATRETQEQMFALTQKETCATAQMLAVPEEKGFLTRRPAPSLSEDPQRFSTTYGCAFGVPGEPPPPSSAAAVGRSGARPERGIATSGMIGEVFKTGADPQHNTACQRVWLPSSALVRAGKGCENPNFKGSYLGRFPLVSADFWTRDHLSERSRP